MRRRHRTLRELIAELRLTPEEAREARAEECMETLFDSARCACGGLGEREEAEIEAERRRWAHVQDSNTIETASSTGL
jgi:hypothetical protein